MKSFFYFHLIYIAIILISSYFFPSITWADSVLYFTPDPKIVQVLSPKFEYTLVDSSSIQIGDILIDSKSLNMQLEINPKSPNSVKLIFTWPTGLTKEGNLTLYNNNGKTIFTQKITKDLTQVSEVKKNQNSDLTRKQISTYSTDYLNEDMSEELKYLPFMKFCLNQKEKETSIDLCSSELYISSDNNRLIVKERKSAKRNSSVFINGKKVGDQGVIFLNDSTEKLSFKAQSESGAALEIATKLSPIEIKEITIEENNKNISIIGSGSFPVNEKNTKKISENLWESKLPSDFPVLYLQGDGGIPIRLEFNIKGQLPKEKLNVSIVGEAKNKTYALNEKLLLKIPIGFSLKSFEDNSKIIAMSKNQKTQWNLVNLTSNQSNRRQIYLTNNNQSYLVSYDFFRGHNIESSISNYLLTPLKLDLLSIDFSYWLNNLISGLQFNYTTALSKPNMVTQFSNLQFSYLHRFSQGLNHIDPSLILGLTYKQLTINSVSLSLPGIVLGLEKKLFSSVADWNKFYFSYLIGQKKQDVNLSSGIQFDLSFQLKIFNSQYINYGLGFSQYNFNNHSDLDKLQISANLGWSILL